MQGGRAALRRPAAAAAWGRPHAGRVGSSASAGSAMAAVQDVEIDPEGTFKYILVRLQRPGGEGQRHIVRGTKAAEFHSG